MCIGLQLKSDWSNTDKIWLSDLYSCHFLSFADWSWLPAVTTVITAQMFGDVLGMRCDVGSCEEPRA